MTTSTSLSLTIVNLRVDIISKVAEIAKAPLLNEKSQLQEALRNFNTVIEERKSRGLRRSRSSETWKVKTELLIQEVKSRLELIEAVIDDCICAERNGFEIDHDELSRVLFICDDRDALGLYCSTWKEQCWLPLWRSSSILSIIRASNKADQIVAENLI